MGDVIAFPGEYHVHNELESDPSLPALAQEATRFSRLTDQQQALETSADLFDASPAQLRMNRVAAGALDVHIDESVRRLQAPPASKEEAHNNLQLLFALAEARPHDVDNLEVAALYTASAYWDGDHVDTAFMAPLLRGHASAALVRSVGSGCALPPVVDMIRAMVTSHITECMDEQRYMRWQQLRHYGLLDFFDTTPEPDPHNYPPAA